MKHHVHSDDTTFMQRNLPTMRRHKGAVTWTVIVLAIVQGVLEHWNASSGRDALWASLSSERNARIADEQRIAKMEQRLDDMWK